MDTKTDPQWLHLEKTYQKNLQFLRRVQDNSENAAKGRIAAMARRQMLAIEISLESENKK